MSQEINMDTEPPKEVTLEEGAALLKSQGGTLRGEITITRAGTGKVEHYTVEMTPDNTEEQHHG